MSSFNIPKRANSELAFPVKFYKVQAERTGGIRLARPTDETETSDTGKIIGISREELGCRTQSTTEVADARSMSHNCGGGFLEGGTMTLLHRAVFCSDDMESMRNLGGLMGFQVVEEA